jgi:glycosyltransferase involved in cell wall biosynthesis
MTRLSVIIPTFDEELHVGRAVLSAAGLGDVVVVDGGSRDRTKHLAGEAGASVIEHPWSGYADQKNWALENLDGDSEWVLFLDADEYLTPELREEIAAAARSGAFDGFYIPRRNVFLGRVLRHAWWYPDYQLRLFRTGKGRFEDRLVHEHVLLDGEPGFLKHPIIHENLKGIDAFIERHLRYAEAEAQEMRRFPREGGADQRHGRLFGSWPDRRRYLKLNVWYRVPMRPAIRFLWMYFVKRGFLDGREGRVYCELMAAQEALINAKLLELERVRSSANSTE